jgi:flagellar export protein FliJ
LQETYAQILDHLQSSLAQVQQGLLLQEKQIEMLKIRFKEAIQERKVIEKIKEKHYAGWRLREARSEGAFLDEIALKKSADAE